MTPVTLLEEQDRGHGRGDEGQDGHQRRENQDAQPMTAAMVIFKKKKLSWKPSPGPKYNFSKVQMPMLHEKYHKTF